MGKQTESRSRITLTIRDIVDYGLLKVGEEVSYHNHRAKVRADYQLEYIINGKTEVGST